MNPIEQLRACDPTQTLLLTDIDGVLAPIVDEPSEARIPAELSDLLQRASTVLAGVGFITGRSLEDAVALAPFGGCWIAACHGMVIRSPDGSVWTDPAGQAARPQLDLTLTMARTVGWRFEDKGYAVTLHFRHANNPSATAAQMRSQIATVLDPTVVELHDARMALEVRPVGGADKGDAARRIAEAVPAHTIVCIGDDVTDLDAFDALKALDQPTISIGVLSEEAPAALAERCDYTVDGQQDVAAILQGLLEPAESGRQSGTVAAK